MELNPAGMNEPESNAELLRLNVGCGRDIQAGWVNIDHADLPGVDISFPGVIPGSLGEDETARHRAAEQRPLLLSFKGVRSHPMRDSLYALHNDCDIVCIDATSERQPEHRAARVVPRRPS